MSGDRFSHPRDMQTLCWQCKNAVPSIVKNRGCNWSRKLEPVEGWDAEETVVGAIRDMDKAKGFRVISCPEFIDDNEPEEEEDEQSNIDGETD